MASTSPKNPKGSPSRLSSLQEKLIPFTIASVSSCTATAIIHPFDTLKVRMQTKSEGGKPLGFFQMAKVMQAEGTSSFYAGLNAALLRQLFYGTTRVGMYRYLYSKEFQKEGVVPFFKKLLFSAFSGATGSFFGSPFDLVLVRTQSDITLPPEKRRNYKGVWEALNRICAKEGVPTLWKSYSINSVRSATLSSVMLSTNDEIKERVAKARNMPRADTPTNVVAALISGAACAFCSLPFDNVKTKYQKMVPLPDGTLPYSSLRDVFSKTLKREGIRGFWTGYSAFFLRVAPHSVIMLLFTDFLHKRFDPNYKL
mgnify:CR=1 FL=1